MWDEDVGGGRAHRNTETGKDPEILHNWKGHFIFFSQVNFLLKYNNSRAQATKMSRVYTSWCIFTKGTNLGDNPQIKKQHCQYTKPPPCAPQTLPYKDESYPDVLSYSFACFWTLYKWNHTTCSLLCCFSSLLLYMAALHSFSLLYSFPLYEYPVFHCLPCCWWPLFLSIFCQLTIVLLCTFLNDLWCLALGIHL